MHDVFRLLPAVQLYVRTWRQSGQLCQQLPLDYKVHLCSERRQRTGTTIDDSNHMFQFLLEEGVRPGELMPIEKDLPRLIHSEQQGSVSVAEAG